MCGTERLFRDFGLPERLNCIPHSPGAMERRPKLHRSEAFCQDPRVGLGTLLAGGSLASAQRNAGYESAFTAGSGLIDALVGEESALPLAMSDHLTARVGLWPAGANACGTRDGANRGTRRKPGDGREVYP